LRGYAAADNAFRTNQNRAAAGYARDPSGSRNLLISPDGRCKLRPRLANATESKGTISMYYAKLPPAFRPLKSEHLVRIGKENDGGYIIDNRDICACDSLISLGINRDWSFEKHFLQNNDVPIFAYDASINLSILYKDIIKSIIRINKPSGILQAIQTVNDYRKFFQGKRQHIPRYVGLDFPPTYIDMRTVFETAERAGYHRPFLKIDVEGFEYRILNEIIDRSNMISGLVVEFHDCDLHADRIVDFISRFSLSLIHIHGNNFGPMCKDRLPLVLEMSFSASPIDTAFAELPSSLDMKNNPQSEDYQISFAD
jgi:hypothetical protein